MSPMVNSESCIFPCPGRAEAFPFPFCRRRGRNTPIAGLAFLRRTFSFLSRSRENIASRSMRKIFKAAMTFRTAGSRSQEILTGQLHSFMLLCLKSARRHKEKPFSVKRDKAMAEMAGCVKQQRAGARPCPPKADNGYEISDDRGGRMCRPFPFLRHHTLSTV